MNIYFAPKETIIYKVAGVSRISESWFYKVIKISSQILAFAAITYQLLSYLKIIETVESYFGWSLIVVGFTLLLVAFNYYYKGFLLHPEKLNLSQIENSNEAGQEINMWRLFSLELSKILAHSGINLNKISSRELFLLIAKTNELKQILLRLAIPIDEVTKLVEEQKMGDNRVAEIFIRSLKIASLENHSQIEIGDLFLALVLFDPVLKNIFFQLKVETADIANVIYWQTKNHQRLINRRKFLDPDHLVLTGGIGRDWAYGYTMNLESYSNDLSETAKVGGFASLELEGKDHQIAQIEEALTRGENHNVIVVGDAGVGKKTLVYGLAKKIYVGQSTRVLSNRRMLELDIEAVISGSNNPNEIVEKLRTIFSESAYAGNIILFIENIANLISSSQKVGQINALEVLLPYFENRNIFVIGTIAPKDYKNIFAPNDNLANTFVKVELGEPSFDETVRIIEDSLPQIEGRTGVLVSYEAIKETVKLSDKFLQDQSQPQKSISLIDQAATKKASGSGGILMPHDIDEVIENQTKVPVGDIENNEKEVLLSLEEKMHSRVVGQKEAITAVASALRRARAGVINSTKPIGSFLFLGPTGVGKTETAKTLAELYFKSEEAMIRFDMSEYQQKNDIYRLIGNPEDENSQGLLTSAIKSRPFSLLLFDEIEKAHPDILNLFLQVLDEGSLTDAFGTKCSFNSSIIIFTSNAGSEFIRQAVATNAEYPQIQKGLLDYVQKANLFRPEFLNRFTGVIVFRPLTLPEITQIAELLIKKLASLLQKEKGITISVDEMATEKLAQMGFDPEMGARPMQRALQEHLENLLANKILSGEIKRGDSLSISVDDLV